MLKDQIYTKKIKNVKIHVESVQGRHFSEKENPAGTLHNIAQGEWGEGIGGGILVYREGWGGV